MLSTDQNTGSSDSPLKQKLEQLKRKQQQAAVENERKRLTDEIDCFGLKYRFADRDESARLEAIITKMDLNFPGQTEITPPGSAVSHDKMYLCFMGGTRELLGIYIYGSFDDILSDMESWEVFSPSLLLISGDMCSYVYINDRGMMTQGSITK